MSGAWPWREGAELSESSPEPPPSPSSSRPRPSPSSPSPSDATTPPSPSSHAPQPRGGVSAPGHAPSSSSQPVLLQEEGAPPPRVPALLRPIGPYSALSPDSQEEGGPAGRPPLGTLWGVATPALQTLLGLVLVLRLPWVVGTGGVLGATAIGGLLAACMSLTAVSLSAIATNGLDPGGGPLGLLSGGLGPAAGGAVGLLAFLSAAFAAAAAALGSAEILLVYVAPGAAVLPGGGRWGRLNNGRGYGAGLLGLLALGAAAPPPLLRLLAPLGPTGLLLALLGLGAGALRPSPPTLCLPAQPGGRLQPCPTALPHGAGGGNGSRGGGGARPALPGVSARLLARNLWPHPPGAGLGGADDVIDDDASFGVLLGLSLPTASGLLWGCSRWGELRDVAGSVPVGSLGVAVGTALGYLGAALLLGASVEGALLRDKFGGSLGGSPVCGAASWPWPWVAVVGGLLSAGGAGLEALLGGSRLLRGLLRARALPLPTAVGRGRLWPLVATGSVGALGVLLGSLDLLAPVLSVFWLTSYLGVNLGCALQGLLPTPGWSPRCRLYHWAVSLWGAGLCLALTLLSCWPCALLAMGIGATAHQYLQFRGAQSEWGEGLRGLFLSAARFALLRLEDGTPHPPSWRPQLLVLVKLDAELVATQPHLVALGAQLQGGKGLLVLGSVLPGDLPHDLPRARLAEAALRAGLAACGARGFVQVLVSGGRAVGLAGLVQGCGVGALRPDTLLLGWPHKWRGDPGTARRFLEALRVAGAGGRSVLVAKGAPPPAGPGGGGGGTLDVWWGRGEGRLLTLLPLLLRQHPLWGGCQIRLFAVAGRGLGGLLGGPAPRRGLPHSAQLVELEEGDVSTYTYERTLMMEQRTRMLRQLQQAQGGSSSSQGPSAGEGEEEEEEEEEEGGGIPGRPSPANVRRMRAAEQLNEALGAHSGGARLVLMDLPPPPPPRGARTPESYLELLEVLTEGLGPVLLVQGGDRDAPSS